MKTRGYLLLLLMLSASLMAFSQAAPAKPTQAPDLTMVLNRQLSNLEREFVPTVEAMPEDKFNYQTTKEVRTFAQQAMHAAATNYYYGSAILGEKNPVQDEENGPPLKTKAEIMKFVKDSFEYAHKAFNSINEKNATELIGPQGRGTRLGLAIGTVGHGFNHYGQMVQYLRINGIVPPASRQQ
jgi:uncharacterized damage-inducible protein DinB